MSALGVSLVIHAATALGFLGVATFRGWPTGKIDIELVSVKVDEVKDLPLGPPPTAGHESDDEDRPRQRRRARPKLAASGGTVVTNASDAGADARADGGAATDASAHGSDAAPRERDLRNYGPEGSRLTALFRLDRLRGAPQAPRTIATVDELLRLLPDRRRLVEGTGIEMYRDFDALLIATPNPLDDAVTFLAVRHHLKDDDLRAGLDRGATTAGRPIVWREEGGRPVGIRSARKPAPPIAIAPGALPAPVAAPPAVDRDDRIFVLPQVGLAVMAPPAYAQLLLAKAAARDAGTGAGAKPTAPDWRSLIARIDAQDGAMPEDAVLMMTATNLLRGRDGATLPADTGLPGELPEYATLTVALAPAPTVELSATFATDAAATTWETRWPGLKQKALANPLLLLGGFMAIVERADLQRDGRTVTLRTTPGTEDLLRILQMVASAVHGRQLGR